MMAASTLMRVPDVHGAAVFGALNSGLDGAAGQWLTPQAQAEGRTMNKPQGSSDSPNSAQESRSNAAGGNGQGSRVSKKGLDL